MEKQHLTNIITLSGKIAITPTLKVSRAGQTYYSATITPRRESGTEDIIPLVIPEALLSHINSQQFKDPTYAHVTGKICAIYNRDGARHNKLRMYVKATAVLLSTATSNENDINELTLDTTLVKPVQLRHTPLGRLIGDSMVRITAAATAPIIVWNKTAEAMAYVQTPSRITVKGRLQSRLFTCLDENNNQVTHTALEMSVIKFEVRNNIDDIDAALPTDIESIDLDEHLDSTEVSQ